jgi:hypothetical protein
MALRREALVLAGPFREGLPLAQEWEWQRRLMAAGGSMVYLPGAWLWHRRSRSDLRVPSLVREFYARGHMIGRLTLGDGGSLPPRRLIATRALRALWHGAAARCMRGLTDGARQAGLLRATLGPKAGGPRSARALRR